MKILLISMLKIGIILKTVRELNLQSAYSFSMAESRRGYGTADVVGHELRRTPQDVNE
jgi:hypothetical protein